MHRFTITVALAAATLTLVSGCSDDQPGARVQGSAPTRVLVEPLGFEAALTRVEAVGTSRAIRSVELHPATSGEVVSVNFEPGQLVARGDVLVELDSRDEQLAVDLARVRLKDAERLYQRYLKTGSSGAVLPTDIDAAKTQVDAARIELDKAKVALDHRTIDAVFDGFVGISDVDAGDRVNLETIITTLDDRSALLVSFEVPELLITNLKVGTQVSLGTWQSRTAEFSGEVVDVGSRIDPTTRTFVARARVDNASDELRPGMSFRVLVDIEGAAYPVIAETAVQWGADGAYVWTVIDGEARRIPVRIVQRNQGRVLVEADLQQGALIVIEGVQRMRDGTAVDYSQISLADDPAANAARVDQAAER